MTQTTTSSYLSRTTPGVYVNEIPSFANSVVGVATAVPLFVGYTGCAGDPVTGASLYNTPVPIASMADYQQYFGGAAPQAFGVVPAPFGATPELSAYRTDGGAGTYAVESAGFDLVPAVPASGPDQFLLYWQMQLFFANGGGNCYVVSVGSYWANQLPVAASIEIPESWLPGSIDAVDLLKGLSAAEAQAGPTMLVVPEACQLASADYAAVVQAMLAQAGSLQDRMAILDVPGCLAADDWAALQAAQNSLWVAVAPQLENIGYGAVYGPALATTIVHASDILFTALAGPAGAGNAVVNDLLSTQAFQQLTGARLALVQGAIAAAFPLGAWAPATNTQQYSNDASGYPPAPPAGDPAALLQWRNALDSTLASTLPVYVALKQAIAGRLNVQPPSGVLAGVWARNDSNTGVWSAPANFAVAGVGSPLVALDDTQQGDLTVPLNGLAINALRSFPARGTVVWGARTLDGNSLDYRYIQVRRTLIYIDQSIRNALQQFAFAANDATTWAAVTAMVSGFLTGLWQQGGLMGTKPSDAFTVQCGLGTTMTAQDVLADRMRVSVTLQMVHPAEFVQLGFVQAMASNEGQT